MPKYVVTRTSIWGEDKMPHPKAELVNAEQYNFCTCKTLADTKQHSWFWRDGTFNHVEINGGTRMSTMEDVWVLDGVSLEELCDEFGELVISKSECPDYEIAVEIYDDYRE